MPIFSIHIAPSLRLIARTLLQGDCFAQVAHSLPVTRNDRSPQIENHPPPTADAIYKRHAACVIARREHRALRAGRRSNPLAMKSKGWKSSCLSL